MSDYNKKIEVLQAFKLAKPLYYSNFNNIAIYKINVLRFYIYEVIDSFNDSR